MGGSPSRNSTLGGVMHKSSFFHPFKFFLSLGSLCLLLFPGIALADSGLSLTVDSPSAFVTEGNPLTVFFTVTNSAPLVIGFEFGALSLSGSFVSGDSSDNAFGGGLFAIQPVFNVGTCVIDNLIIYVPSNGGSCEFWFTFSTGVDSGETDGDVGVWSESLSIGSAVPAPAA